MLLGDHHAPRVESGEARKDVRGFAPVENVAGRCPGAPDPLLDVLLGESHDPVGRNGTNRGLVSVAAVQVPGIDEHTCVRGAGESDDLPRGRRIGDPRPRQELERDDDAVRSPPLGESGESLCHLLERGRQLTRNGDHMASSECVGHTPDSLLRIPRRSCTIDVGPITQHLVLGDLDAVAGEDAHELGVRPTGLQGCVVVPPTEADPLASGLCSRFDALLERPGIDRLRAEDEIVRSEHASRPRLILTGVASGQEGASRDAREDATVNAPNGHLASRA